jgi:hypothetical protein
MSEGYDKAAKGAMVNDDEPHPSGNKPTRPQTKRM